MKIHPLFPAAMIILFVACNNNKQDNVKNNRDTTVTNRGKSDADRDPAGRARSLAGKWKTIEADLRDMSDADKTDLQNTTIEFSADGSYTTIMKDLKISGTYTYDPASKKMTTTNPERGTVTTYSIAWEGTDLVMKDAEGWVKLRRL
jgi:hypothetical protein